MSGKMVVISGFSGAGKGTVIKRLREKYEGYVLSVSMTTRKPRDYETNGVEYHFVSNERFEELIAQNGFMEYAGYADHYYGTPEAFVHENMRAGQDVLLEIEVQGAMQIRGKYPDTLMVFIAPPDAEELERRLTGRGSEQEETVNKRLRQAATEEEMIPEYDYLLINDDVDACADSLNRIIRMPEEAVSGGGSQNASKGGEIVTDAGKKKVFTEAFRTGLQGILQRRGIL